MISNISTLPHPPYNSDLSPLDFKLFPKLKELMKGYRYENLEDIQCGVTSVFNGLTSEVFSEIGRILEQVYQTLRRVF